MNVLDFIKDGKENAITREELKRIFHVRDDRIIRDEIKRLRGKGIPILNDQDGDGYYISDDIDQIRRFARQERSRGNSSIQIANALEKLLENPEQINWRDLDRGA